MSLSVGKFDGPAIGPETIRAVNCHYTQQSLERFSRECTGCSQQAKRHKYPTQ